MTKKITRAVFPVAGLGTRFLPATKASPKEMLPIVNKPLIQYATEEAVSAGLTELIFIIGGTKQSIAEHFSRAHELESELEKKNKTQALEIVKNIIPDKIACSFIQQSQPLGLGHAILCAEDAVGNNPFAVLLPDDLISTGKQGVIQQMLYQYEQHGCSMVAVENVPRKETDKYGIVSLTDKGQRLDSIVEKPDADSAPSTLAVVGRYILTSSIFKYLKAAEPGAGGEVQLTDSIADLLADEPVHAYEFEGTRYDCGSKFGYIKASIDYALRDPDIGKVLKSYLTGRLQSGA